MEEISGLTLERDFRSYFMKRELVSLFQDISGLP